MTLFAAVFGFGASVPAPTSSSPLLGAGTTFEDGVNGTEFGFSGHTAPGSADLVALAAFRHNSTPQSEPKFRWGGTTATDGAAQLFTRRLWVKRDEGADNLAIVIATLRNATAGAKKLWLAGSSSFGDPVVRVWDLTGWGGSVGSSASTFGANNSATPLTASGAVAVTGGLIVGVYAGRLSGSASTFALSAPFTEVAETSSGTVNASAVDAAFGSATGGAAASTTTLTAVHAGATPARLGAAWLELV